MKVVSIFLTKFHHLEKFEKHLVNYSLPDQQYIFFENVASLKEHVKTGLWKLWVSLTPSNDLENFSKKCWGLTKVLISIKPNLIKFGLMSLKLGALNEKSCLGR